MVRVWLWASMGSGISRMVNYLSFGAMSLLGLVRTRQGGLDRRRVPDALRRPARGGLVPPARSAGGHQRRRSVGRRHRGGRAISEGAGRRPCCGGSRRGCSRVRPRYGGDRGRPRRAGREGRRPREDRLAAQRRRRRDVRARSGRPAVDQELGLAEGEHLFLYAGTQGYVHGLDVILDAAALLDDLPVRFVLVGGGLREAGAAGVRCGRGPRQRLVPRSRRARGGRPVPAPGHGRAWPRSATWSCSRSVRSAKMFPTMATAKPVLYAGADEGAALVRRAGAGITAPGDGAALAAAVRRLVAGPGGGRRARCRRTPVDRGGGELEGAHRAVAPGPRARWPGPTAAGVATVRSLGPFPNGDEEHVRG